LIQIYKSLRERLHFQQQGSVGFIEFCHCESFKDGKKERKKERKKDRKKDRKKEVDT